MKLLFFTLAMIVVPIGSYYATVDTIFRGELARPPGQSSPPTSLQGWIEAGLIPLLPVPGNSTFAGAMAAVMANVVLIGYIVVAYNEDQSDQVDTKKKEGKKQR